MKSVSLNCLIFYQAIAGLNGMQLGDKKLLVQRASVGSIQECQFGECVCLTADSGVGGVFLLIRKNSFYTVYTTLLSLTKGATMCTY